MLEVCVNGKVFLEEIQHMVVLQGRSSLLFNSIFRQSSYIICNLFF